MDVVDVVVVVVGLLEPKPQAANRRPHVVARINVRIFVRTRFSLVK